jgi:hypothetical protein
MSARTTLSSQWFLHEVLMITRLAVKDEQSGATNYAARNAHHHAARIIDRTGRSVAV